MSSNNMPNHRVNNKIYKIQGMHCVGCASMIELDLEDAGYKAKCSYSKGTLEIAGDCNFNKVVNVVKRSGYSVSPID